MFGKNFLQFVKELKKNIFEFLTTHVRPTSQHSRNTTMDYFQF